MTKTILFLLIALSNLGVISLSVCIVVSLNGKRMLEMTTSVQQLVNLQMMTINLNVNFENAPDWHFGNNIFGGSSDKASSGSSSDSNLNEADFEDVNEGKDKGEDKSGFSQKVMPLLPFIPQLPEELKSEKAARILMRLYKEEILDENFQPLNLSNYQKAYLAFQISVALGINNVWKVFSRFWNMKPSVMRTRYNDALSMPSILDFGEKSKNIYDNAAFW